MSDGPLLTYQPHSHVQAINVDAVEGTVASITPTGTQLLIVDSIDMVGHPTAGSAGVQLRDEQTGALRFYFNTATAVDIQYVSWRGFMCLGPSYGFQVVTVNGTWDVTAHGIIVPYFP